MIKANSKSKGELTEAIIIAKVLSLGYSVSIPFGNNQRYDLIIDDGKKLFRVQCKTAHLVNGCLSFSVSSINGFTKRRTNYEGQVEFFLVYEKETNEVYKIPIEECGKSSKRLRINPPNGGTKSNIRWAKDYLFK